MNTRTGFGIGGACLLLGGCGPAEQSEGGMTRDEATSSNAPGATPPPLTDQTWNGSQYSVSIYNVCSAQMINPWYLVTAAHCAVPSTITLQRAATIQTAPDGHKYNGQTIWSGPVATYIPTLATQTGHSGHDVQLVELLDPVGVDTCEWSADSCGIDKPINGRFMLGPVKQYGSPLAADGLDLFGWGFGQTAAPDTGLRNVQRHSVLHLTNQGFTTSNDWTQTGSAPIHRNAGFFTYDAQLGYQACQGDSGASLLHQVSGKTWVTDGIVKSGTDWVTCNSGEVPPTAGGTGNQALDSSMAQLIFQRERINGYAVQGNPNSGRFKCQVMNDVDGMGRRIDYWVCDNGHRFSGWAPGFTTNRGDIASPVTFDTAQDVGEFEFVTPSPNTLGPPNWQWSAANGGTLYEPTDIYGTGTMPTGTNAIHKTAILHNGFAQVNVNSTDTGYAGVFLRYVDDTHYYLFLYGTWACGIAKRDGDSFTYLATCPVATGFNSVNLAFVAQDDTLYADVNGTTVATATDSTATKYKIGRTGIFKRSLNNTYFDSFIVDIE